MQKKKSKLIRMSDIETEQVHWLWYPFIPYGKFTIIQGDPGEGKTSFVLAMIALLTTGKPLPEGREAAGPISVIYQSAEDGLADTIKPRLEMSGADCSRVLVIDESDKELTLCDERLEQAVQETGAMLIVLDPLQAYLGDNVDMHRANEVRPVFKRLCAMADRTGCAIILIGHINKAQGLKSSYRGLGSIDFRFQWIGYCDVTVDDVLSGTGSVQTKTVQKEDELRRMLVIPVPAEEVFKRAAELGISERTVNIAKKNVGIDTMRVGNRWHWRLSDSRL
jgi:hypothetical protein